MNCNAYLIYISQFLTTVQELEVWVSETVKRMSSTEPPETVSHAQALLEVHNDRKVRLNNRYTLYFLSYHRIWEFVSALSWWEDPMDIPQWVRTFLL